MLQVLCSLMGKPCCEYGIVLENLKKVFVQQNLQFYLLQNVDFTFHFFWLLTEVVDGFTVRILKMKD